MPDTTSIVPKGRSDLTPQFRTAPWFILRNKNVKSNGDALILSVLWTALQNIDAGPPGSGPRRLSITNEEISRRSGLGCKPKVIRYHLARLEKLNMIGRSGNHKNREIELFLLPSPDDDLRSLIIPEDIFLSNLSPTKKLIASITRAFPKMKGGQICQRLGITEDTYYHNIRNLQPPQESQSNPPKNPSEPPQESQPLLGIGGRDQGIDYYPTDNRRPEVAKVEKSNPSREDTRLQTTQGSSPEFDYGKAGYLKRKRGVTPPKKNIPIPEDIMVELTDEVFPNRHITRATRNSTMAAAARVVRALRREGGLSTILDGPQIELVVKCLTSNGSRLDPAQIRATLHRQFSDEERVELYERISNSMSPAYVGGHGKNVSLADAAFLSHGSPGFSRLVKVWLQPPRPKEPVMPTPKIVPEFEGPVKAIREKCGPDLNLFFVISVLKDLKRIHGEQVAPLLDKLKLTKGRMFRAWFADFLRYAYNIHDRRLNPGHLKPANKTFQDWDAEFRREARFEADQIELGRRKREWHAKLDEIKAVEDFIDEYGESAARQRYPLDLVDKAARNLMLGL